MTPYINLSVNNIWKKKLHLLYLLGIKYHKKTLFIHDKEEKKATKKKKSWILITETCRKGKMAQTAFTIGLV
jgi:hypothetical protein